MQLLDSNRKISARHVTTQALTEDTDMNSRQRYKAKRAAAHRERKEYCQKIERAFSRLSEDCSNRVLRATSLCSLRDSNTSGSACLPDVGLYAAGYRNSKDSVTAR